MSLDIFTGREECKTHRWAAPEEYPSLPCPCCYRQPYVEHVSYDPEPAKYYNDSNEIPEPTFNTVTFRRKYGRPDFGKGTYSVIIPVWVREK